MDHEDESSSGNAGHQNLNDLHNYLTTFNKEIEPVEDVLSTMGVDTEVGDVGDLYTPSGSHSLQEAGEVAVAGQFSSSFYSEQGILDNPLSDEAGQSISGLESVPDRVGEEDLTSTIKQEVGTMDLSTVQEHIEGLREHAQLTTNISDLQNQGLIMTSLAEESLDPTGGKIIRIVSLGDEGQYLTLGDGSQMQILSQDLTLDTAAASDTSYVIQETEIASAATPAKARSILSLPANSHLGLSGKNSTMATSLLTSAPSNSGVSNTISSSTNEVSDMAQLVALQSGDAGSQPQLMTLPTGTPITLAAEGLQQYGILSADGTNAASELSYQTINVVPTELNQEGMNYVLVMTPQDADNKEAVAQLVDLKQESQGEVREELVEVNGELKRVLHMVPVPVPKKLFSASTVSGGVNMGTQLMCDYCDYTSPKRYLLTRHMKSHSDERPHKCSECHRGFKTPASLLNHVNTHTGTRPHKCKTCDAAFTTSGELVRHIRYRHTFEKPHRCPSCDYASVELSKLKRHMRSHTGERPYKCPHCRYASPDTYKLKRHLRIHTGEKPYECDICHARFTQSNSLKAHKLIHSGNKPVFQCTLCPTTCGRKTDLKIHFNKLHSIGSPLECKKCGQILADRYSFKQHMRTHDMDRCFKCDQCDFIANTERSLDQHAAIHSNGKKYECKLCHMTFNLQQTLEKHSLTCTLDPNFNTEPIEKGNVTGKSGEESLLVKSENTSPALPSKSHEDTGNLSTIGKTLAGSSGQDVFPTPVLASDTLHKNLMQDIKAGKLGDVPQVVIVHPDGTLEEIPSASGDKLNLDDIFSALSNTEKQERGIQNEVVQSSQKQEDAGVSEGSGLNAETSESTAKSDEAVETAQCEASTQAELESDSDSLDESKTSDSLPIEQVNHPQENDSDVKESSQLEPATDNSPALISCDSLNQTVEDPSCLLEDATSSAHHSKASASLAEPALSSALESSLSSTSSLSQSVSQSQLSPTLSIVNNSKANSTAISSTSNMATPASSSDTPQYVVVKGYTCLSEDGNTVQPTLVNVAVDKDSLMKMFASLGPAGDGMGLQLLSGDFESSLEPGEDVNGRIAQASIISLHDMANLTAMGDAEVAEIDNSNLSGLGGSESLSNRDSGLTELCSLAGMNSGQSEAASRKDSEFISTSAFELTESCHSSSSVISSRDVDLTSLSSESSVSKSNSTTHELKEKGGEGSLKSENIDKSSLSTNAEFAGEKMLSLKKQSVDVDKVAPSVIVKLPPASSNPLVSHQESSSSSVFKPQDKQSPLDTSKANSLTDQKLASSPNDTTDHTQEVKIGLSEDNLCEPLELVDVEGASMFHMSDDRSVSIQPTFSNAPLGNLFTDSLIEEGSYSSPDPSISDGAGHKEESELDVCGETEQNLESDKLNLNKLEGGDTDKDLQERVETPSKLNVKEKRSAKKRASSSPAVDSNLVRTGKRVRKALVKVSM